MNNAKIFPPNKWELLLSEDREQFLPIQKFIQLARPKTGDVWLDFGSGPGYFTLPLAKHLKKIYALDISKEMLDICRRRAMSASLANIEYLVSDGRIIPIPELEIDTILLANVFHEISDIEKTMLEFRRILKPTGNILIIDWKYKPMSEGPPLEQRIQEKQVINMLKGQGFLPIKNFEIFEKHYFIMFGM